MACLDGSCAVGCTSAKSPRGLQEEQDGGSVGGLALHVALRIAALAKPGEVLVSGTLRDLLAGFGLRFRERDARLPLGPAAGGVRLQLLSLAADDRNGQEPARSEPAGNHATASEIAELTRRERTGAALDRARSQ